MGRREALLFVALFLGGACFYQPVDYDNSKSRFILLSAVVDQGSLSIDAQQHFTLDKAYHDGHYYSNKPIGAPLLAVPVYWLLRRTVLGPVEWLRDPTILADHPGKYLVRMLTTTLPFALLGLVMLRVLSSLGAPPVGAFLAVLAHGFGTIALNHAALFSGHCLAGAFAFFSFAALLSLRSGQGGPRLAGFAGGLCAGLSALCDFTGMYAALCLAVYALASPSRRSAKGGFLAGAAVCAAVLGLYNQLCFGRFWSFSYAHLESGPFGEEVSRGLFGVTLPDPGALYALLLSPARGLFFVSPVLLLSLAGWREWRGAEARRERRLVAGIAAGAVLLNASYFGWHGGWTNGPRYLVAALPFICLPIGWAGAGAAFWWLFALSAFQVWCAQAGVPHVPQEIRNPVAEFILPLMGSGASALTPLGTAGGPLWGAMVACAIGVLVWRAHKGLAAAPPPLPVPFKVLAALWACLVAAGLATVRTQDERTVHRYRGIVLFDHALATGSPEIEKAARREIALSEGKGG